MLLISTDIHKILNELGYVMQEGKKQPSYAWEHFLGNEIFVYIKFKKDQPVIKKAPLVIPPSSLNFREKIDAIHGVLCKWKPTKSTSYRNFPKSETGSQYGFDVDIESTEALHTLISLLLNKDIPPNLQKSEPSIMKSSIQTFPLNQILYGPPGTGKTYITTEMAVKIIEPEWFAETQTNLSEKDLRKAVKAKYQLLLEKGHVNFTTFHQSFSYEDFIEGIRASTDDENGSIKYEIADGVFKQLCINANVKIKSGTAETVTIEGKRIWKMSLGNTLESEEFVFDECVNNNYVVLGYGDDINFNDCHSRDSIKEKLKQAKGTEIDKNDYALTSVNIIKNIVKKGDIIIVSDGNHKFRAIAEVTGDYEFLPKEDRVGYQQMRRVKWLRIYEPSLPRERLFKKALSQMSLYELRSKTIDHEKLEQLLVPDKYLEEEHQPHVLIIDEINRGNISRIFGELITLLEPSKRSRSEDAQFAILPYSKQLFSVPDNVYVIATMNTADKSLAQLDLALRRRFSFTEMPPNPSLLNNVEVYGVNVSALLRTMNARIEVLLDAEHMIGHAYFLPLIDAPSGEKREQELTLLFRDKVIPLLKEYFFDDYERIGWVLNDPSKAPADRFIRSIDSNNGMSLASLFGDEVSSQLTDRRYRINADAYTRPSAYQGIVDGIDA